MIPAPGQFAFAGRGHANNPQRGPANTTASSGEIDGSVGGTVRSGRWTVVIPAGAFSGVGSVTVTSADNKSVVCDLDIKPGNLNKFSVPVELIFSTSGLDVDPATFTIYWYDSETKKWVDVHGTGDRGKQTVTALLDHFPIYCTGRAGW